MIVLGICIRFKAVKKHEARPQLREVLRSVGHQPTFWELAGQSRRTWLGGGFFVLGLLFFGLIADDALHGERYSDSARYLTVEAVLLLLSGAGLFSWGVSQVHWWLRLYARGQETEAIVTKVKLSRMQPYGGRRLYFKRPRNATYIVHYKYQDPLGTMHRGHSGYLLSGPEPGLQAGDRVRIRFDPEYPGKSMWIGPAEDNHSTG